MKIYDKLVRAGSDLVMSTRTTTMAVGVVAAVVCILGVLVDYQNTDFFERELHTRIEGHADLIRAKVQSRVESYIAIVGNFADQLAAEPLSSPALLQARMQQFRDRNPDFDTIAVAPDFKVAAITPNESPDIRSGTDLLQIYGSPEQLKSSQPRFIGPVLTEDMRGAFVVLYPLVERTRLGQRVWGAIEAIVDENTFYRRTDLLQARKESQAETGDSLRFAIRDTSAGVNLAHPFFGDEGLNALSPVNKEVRFPGGHWQISAVPAEGWQGRPHNQMLLRLLLLISGSVILIPITAALQLLADRNRMIHRLQSREAELSTLSQRLDLALDASKIGVWELEDDHHSLYFDACTAALHGFPEMEGTRPISQWLDAVHGEDRVRALSHFISASTGQTDQGTEYRIIRPDGETRHLRSAGSHIEDANGSRTAGIVWDVTEDVKRNDTLRVAKENTDIKNAELELALDELSARERELEELSRKLDLALDSYNCGIWEASLPDGTAFWDERMYQLFNRTGRDGAISVSQWVECLVPDDRTAFRQAFNSLSAFNGKDSVICRVDLGKGECRYVRLVGQIHQDGVDSYNIVGMAFDMTQDALMTAELKAAKDEADAKNAELREAKERIEHNALHDPLTGIANRRRLDLALEELSRRSEKARIRFAVLHLDLDRFKQINDTLGHAAGDAMLVNASEILRRNVRAGDLVARIGGDEFVILVEGTVDDEDLAALSQRIIDEMRHPVDFQGFACRCGVSIGIATANGKDIDARKMLINADVALYRAKNEGRNCYQFFTHELHAEIITSKRVADDILAGLERGEFTAWYQPQFDARTLALTGAEALVRWNHPVKGILTPDCFLKIAEDLNVVQTLDRIILETALRDKYRWAARGLEVPRLSVNVSAKRLHDQMLYDTLKDLPIGPGEIAFELVEAIFLDESADLVNLERVKELGIEIEIDDFGTGHTSIVSLLRLKPKRLKIDRQLVKPIIDSPQERALVRSIVEIARSLGVETIAEGVETMEHARLLADLGCDILQGYAFAKPLTFEEFWNLGATAAWRYAS